MTDRCMDLVRLALPDTATLVAMAEARLRRRRGYARPLAGRPGPARRLEGALMHARAILVRAAPAAAWREICDIDAWAEGLHLEGRRLHAPRLADEVRAGARLCLWLCTLGQLPPPAPGGQLDGAGATERPASGGSAAVSDPLNRHVLEELAHQTLYAAARAAHAGLAAEHPGRQVLRMSLRRPGERLWDAEALFGLLPLLGPCPLGVTADRGVALSPPHSLLGLAVVRAGGMASPSGGPVPD